MCFQSVLYGGEVLVTVVKVHRDWRPDLCASLSPVCPSQTLCSPAFLLPLLPQTLWQARRQQPLAAAWRYSSKRRPHPPSCRHRPAHVAAAAVAAPINSS